ncbi:DALR anticodon-binding domain-containing protein 3-like isoform X2 [Branchiostoma floridae]|uniref:DALR anticodon-binding domain-containing protein 3-like isoform X2 n=1 Tax=Branchiostoma floridae TaxID=7739 RepID=A0A9J7L743_BRAFL|nr:DALR anticodon-binding domain-containing protein 3-like isoform X2 [Branchiostoma floridae]
MAESGCLLNSFSKEFEDFLGNRAQCKDFKKPGRSVLLKQSTKLRNGDFVVPSVFVKAAFPEQANLESFLSSKEATESLLSLSLPVQHLSTSADGRLCVKLSQPLTFHKVLSSVEKLKSNYGCLHSSGEKVAIVNLVPNYYRTCDDDVNDGGQSLVQLRGVLIASHVAALLKARGFVVHDVRPNIQGALGDFWDSLCDGVQASAVDLVSATQEKILQATAESKYRISNIQERRHLSSHDDEGMKHCERRDEGINASGDRLAKTGEFVLLDLKKFIDENNLQTGKEWYDPNLKTVTVLEGHQPTRLLEEVIFLQRTLDSVQTKAPVVVHVASHGRSFHSQQVDMTWRTLNPCEVTTSQTHLVYNSVAARKSTSTTEQLTAQDFWRLRHAQMREASVLKYGDAVQGAGWEDTITAMTAAAIKFELLFTSCQNIAKLDLSIKESGEGPQDNKGGAFILYNCARLATLFKHYQEDVQAGVYPDLPDISSVDLSLLKEEEEWELLFNYILPYPYLVQGTIVEVNKTRAKILTHQVCSFLIALSRDLSSYYRRVRVLLEPRAHLLPVMFARLHLLKGVQQVMHNGLSLLGIQPLAQM